MSILFSCKRFVLQVFFMKFFFIISSEFQCMIRKLLIFGQLVALLCLIMDPRWEESTGRLYSTISCAIFEFKQKHTQKKHVHIALHIHFLREYVFRNKLTSIKFKFKHSYQRALQCVYVDIQSVFYLISREIQSHHIYTSVRVTSGLKNKRGRKHHITDRYKSISGTMKEFSISAAGGINMTEAIFLLKKTNVVF